MVSDIPKFDTALLYSNWNNLRRKYLSQIPTDINVLSCGPKAWKISWISDTIPPAWHPQKSSQHVRACAAGDGGICSKNRKIVPYHGTNPNTRNGALLQSPSPIMAPACTYIIIMLYLFLSLKSFNLEIRFINIQQDTLTFTDLIPVEQILKNFDPVSRS